MHYPAMQSAALNYAIQHEPPRILAESGIHELKRSLCLKLEVEENCPTKKMS